MKHPQDAYDNKPRGKYELLECFRNMGLEVGDVLAYLGYNSRIDVRNLEIIHMLADGALGSFNVLVGDAGVERIEFEPFFDEL